MKIKVIETSPEQFVVVAERSQQEAEDLGELVVMVKGDHRDGHIIDECIWKNSEQYIIRPYDNLKNKIATVSITINNNSKELCEYKYQLKLIGSSYFPGKNGLKNYWNSAPIKNTIGQAELIIVLHCHTPFIKPGVEGIKYLEERWFPELLMEVYLPLILKLEQNRKYGVKLTVSISPTVFEMMADQAIMKSFSEELIRIEKLARDEVKRTSTVEGIIHSLNNYPSIEEIEGIRSNHTKIVKNANKTLEQIVKIKDFLELNDFNVIDALKRFDDNGDIELMVCAGTHTILPMIQDVKLVKLHIDIARQCFVRYIGKPPRGIWLPENAYFEGLEGIVKDVGFEYFFVASHGVDFSTNKRNEPDAAYRFHRTKSGAYVLARNNRLNTTVWDKQVGYPGNAEYYEYSRDIGYDLKYEYVREHLLSGHDEKRHHVGIKYHAVTDRRIGLGNKKFRDPMMAMKDICKDARDHAHTLYEETGLAYELQCAHPVFIEMYDAELFGHWWKEGMDWLFQLPKQLRKYNRLVKPVTAGGALDSHKKSGKEEEIEPATSSWGFKGFFDQWVNDKVIWYWLTEWNFEELIIMIIKKDQESDGIFRDHVNQALRELLLYQASDWIFLITNGSCVEYSKRKLQAYAQRFFLIVRFILDECELTKDDWENMCREDSIFPWLDYRNNFM